MGLDAPTGSAEDLIDEVLDLPVTESVLAHEGMVWDVRRDTVELGKAGRVTREYLEHPGAVHVVALREVDGVPQLLMIRQYRHPVRTLEWELPAGLLDVQGEPPWRAAERELREEVDLAAAEWHVLVDYYASPGGMSEVLRIFLARGLRAVPEGDRFDREGEEAGMLVLWVPLEQAYAAVLAGQLHNPGALIGIMAAHGAQERGWATLRPRDEPWPWHPAYR